MARYVILKNIEGSSAKTAAFKIEDDGHYYLGTVSDPYDVGTFGEISGQKGDRIIDILNFILSEMSNNHDTTMSINGYDYDALRVSKKRLFENVDEDIKKQFENAIKIRSNKVEVDFRNIFQEVREVSSILKERYEERDRVGFDFLIRCGSNSERIEDVLKKDQSEEKDRLTIIRSLTGGINQALLSSALQLAEDEDNNVIYLEEFERNSSPLFNAIKAEYKTDLMNTTNVQIYILINLQNDKIVSDNYVIEGILENVEVLWERNSQARIVIGYKDTKALEEPLKKILNKDNKDIYTLGVKSESLMKYFDKNNIPRPEDENVSQLLELNMDFLCDYTLNYRENSDLDKLLLHLSTEDIIEAYSDDLSRVDRNNKIFFSIVTSILYENDAMNSVFNSQEFDEKTIESFKQHYPLYFGNTVEEYRKVGRSLNAMTAERWADSTDNYYIAKGIIDRIDLGGNVHGVLKHLENKLHTDKPESSDLLTARFLVDGLGINDEESMNDVLKKISDKEDKVLFTMILGRLLDHFETIRNGKKYIADKVKIAIKYLKDYWKNEQDEEELEYLLVSLCYGALQTQSVVSDENYLLLCKTSEETLQFIIGTKYFDKNDPLLKAEKSRIMSNLGAAYLAMGKALMKDESEEDESEEKESKRYLEKAKSAHEEARDLRESIKDNPEILKIEPDFVSKRYAKSLTNIATCYYWLKDYEKSKEYHELANKENENQSILSCIRFGGTLLESTLSREKILQIIQLFKRASDLMKKTPDQYHAEVQNLKDNYKKLIEKLKDKRSLLCRCIFDLLDLATDVDGIYYSEYYSNNTCKYLALRTFISPVEKLIDIYKEDIKSTLKIIENRNKNDLHLDNAFKLAENPSASKLSDADYVNACHFILNNCFDYRWKMKVIKENAAKKRIKEEDKADLELVKSYFDSVVKELNPASEDIKWRYQEDEDNPELSNIIEKISSTRQGIIDDGTAQKHRDEIIDIIKDFDLLNSSSKYDSEFENIKKNVVICPLGATANAIYNRTKAACDLFKYFTEKKKVPSVMFYGLGSEKTDSIDRNDFAELAKEKDMPTWDKDKKPSETDVMLYAFKKLFPDIEMTRVSTRDAKSERYIKNVNCIYKSKDKDEKFVIASFHNKSSNTQTQTRHVLKKFKSDYCLVFVSTSIYRDFTISVIRRNIKEFNEAKESESKIDPEIHFFGTEYKINDGDSVCKAIQEIKVALDEIIKTYEEKRITQ